MDILAFALKEHLYKMYTQNLTWEYMDQIEAWKLYIDNIADMVENVSKSQVDTLQEAHAEIEAAKAAAMAQAMFVLDLIAIPAVSWLSAAIKIKWAPKLTTESRLVAERNLDWGKRLAGVVWKTEVTEISGVPFGTEPSPSPVANQVIGDIGKLGAGFIADLVRKPLKTSPHPFKPPDTKFVQNSNDWQSFRTGLKKTLYDQQQFGQGQIRSIADDIENDAIAVGQGLVDKLYKDQPKLKDLDGPNADDQRYQAGAAMINKELNARRADWAKDWLYYGNDPPDVKSSMKILMEREIWALWIVENILEGDYETVDGAKVPTLRPPDNENDWYVMTNAVLSRLRYLATPLSPSTWQALAAPDPKLYNAAREIQDPQNPDYDPREDPTVNDDPDVYSPYWHANTIQKGLQDLLSWAKTHVPALRPLDYGVPRGNLTPIEVYTGKYAGNYQHPAQF